MNKTSLAMHTARHQQMLDFQETIKPFTPTVAEMAGVWFLSKFAAHHEMQVLVKIGLAIVRKGRVYAIKGKITR